MNQEHYSKKIERNTYVIDKAPEEIRAEIANNIRWCVEVSKRLDNLDPSQRDNVIREMHRKLDEDYKRMGFEIEEEKGKTL